MATVVLVDLSSILHREFAIHQQDGDANATAHQVLDKVRRLAAGQPHVAICCDAGRSFRKDVNPAYKAQRAERDPSLYHQQAIVVEKLRADGFPIWSVQDFEADDLIATATRLALEREGLEVLIVSIDKDLCQLISPRVQMKRADTGVVLDEDAVAAKFGIRPDQLRDWLCLVGDKSDNIVGAKGIGDKTAAKLLARFGTLRDLYEDFDRASATEKKTLGFTPALVDSLTEFAARLDDVRQLVTLRTDATIPFDEVFAERVRAAVAEYDPDAGYEADGTEEPMSENDPQEVRRGPSEAANAAADRPEEAGATTTATTEAVGAPASVTTLVPRTGEILPPWEQRLLPRDFREARIVAKDIHDAHLFSAFGSPQAVLTAVMLGAEFGMPPVAALRGVHIIEGKPSMSAGLMAAVVLKSGLAEYFEPVEISDKSVTFETLRKGARNPLRITHTIEMAKQAWSKGKTPAEREESWAKSGWGRNPTDMLVARCQARLARYAYPDLLAGMYSPEELAEIRDEERKAS